MHLYVYPYGTIHIYEKVYCVIDWVKPTKTNNSDVAYKVGWYRKECGIMCNWLFFFSIEPTTKKVTKSRWHGWGGYKIRWCGALCGFIVKMFTFL